MKDLTKKILESGLVDEATADLMEQWGVLPEGAAALAQGKAEALEQQTKSNKDVRARLIKFADDIGEEVEKTHKLKETMLDMNQFRWPVTVAVLAKDPDGGKTQVTGFLSGVIDRHGRFYFRPADVVKGWLIPGRILERGDSGNEVEVLEVTELFIGDEVGAIQVSTR